MDEAQPEQPTKEQRKRRDHSHIRQDVLANCLSPLPLSHLHLATKLGCTKDDIRNVQHSLVHSGILIRNPDIPQDRRFLPGVANYILGVDPATVGRMRGLPERPGGGTGPATVADLFGREQTSNKFSIPDGLFPLDRPLTEEDEVRIITWLSLNGTDPVKLRAVDDLRERRNSRGVGVGPPGPTNDEEQTKRLVQVLQCCPPEMRRKALAIVEQMESDLASEIEAEKRQQVMSAEKAGLERPE